MSSRMQTNVPEPVYSSFLLWYGVLAGPIIWLVHLFVTYGVATIVCAPGQVTVLHAATALAGLIALSSAVVGARARAGLHDEGLQGEELQSDGKQSDSQETLAAISNRRARFLATFAICNGVIFLAVIVVQSLPNFFLDPCLSVG